MIVNYSPKDIKRVLVMMAEYALECEEEQELQYYFEQMTATGLFHDAVGKVVEQDGLGNVSVITEY